MVGKLNGKPVPTTTGDCLHNSRLFVQDRNSGHKFLVDSGAAVSCFPRHYCPASSERGFTLSAANGTVIQTYGLKRFNMDVGLRRVLPWNFIIADVTHPIIGADFLEAFGIIVDVRNRHLIDSLTTVRAKGVLRGAASSCTPLAGKVPYNAVLTKYSDVFSDHLRSGSSHQIQHHIETTGPPVFAKARRLSGDKLAVLKKEFDLLLQQGIIRSSSSPWASPIHFVKKKDGTWRICGDYRRLNAVTLPDRYPLPHMHDILLNLGGKAIFSKIDLKKAYHQIPVADADIQKTAVITPIGLFEYNNMTFGLRNAAQTFQRFMDQILRGLTCCVAYIDDILVASVDATSHCADLELVFRRLKQYGIVVNGEKCVFGVNTLSFLGHQISEQGIAPLPERVQSIVDYPTPKSVTELRRFLALLNFHHRFLERAAEKQACLQELVAGKGKRDKTPVELNDAQTDAFNACKQMLAQATLLFYPLDGAKVSLVADASETAVGACLRQTVQGELQPLGFNAK